MTDIELRQYYTDLLILQYKRDNIIAHVDASLKPVIIFELIEDIKNGYNIETAVGVQLDVLGKYIGLDRQLSDGTTTTDMIDADFRNYLKFKIVKNFSNHSLKSVDDMLKAYFTSNVKVEDNQDMSGTYIIYNDLTLAKVLKYEQLYPKPMGVRIEVIVTSDIPFAYDLQLVSGIGGGWGKIAETAEDMTFKDGSTATFKNGSTVELKVFDPDTPDGDATTGKWSCILDE
jgi:hypothetical protein